MWKWHTHCCLWTVTVWFGLWNTRHVHDTAKNNHQKKQQCLHFCSTGNSQRVIQIINSYLRVNNYTSYYQIYCWLVLVDLNDLKMSKTDVFRPLFRVNLRNCCLMDEVLTGAVFLELLRMSRDFQKDGFIPNHSCKVIQLQRQLCQKYKKNLIFSWFFQTLA